MTYGPDKPIEVYLNIIRMHNILILVFKKDIKGFDTKPSIPKKLKITEIIKSIDISFQSKNLWLINPDCIYLNKELRIVKEIKNP